MWKRSLALWRAHNTSSASRAGCPVQDGERHQDTGLIEAVAKAFGLEVVDEAQPGIRLERYSEVDVVAVSAHVLCTRGRRRRCVAPGLTPEDTALVLPVDVGELDRDAECRLRRDIDVLSEPTRFALDQRNERGDAGVVRSGVIAVVVAGAHRRQIRAVLGVVAAGLIGPPSAIETRSVVR